MVREIKKEWWSKLKHLLCCEKELDLGVRVNEEPLLCIEGKETEPGKSFKGPAIVQMKNNQGQNQDIIHGN